jgi:hypothetical protein
MQGRYNSVMSPRLSRMDKGDLLWRRQLPDRIFQGIVVDKGFTILSM